MAVQLLDLLWPTLLLLNVEHAAIHPEFKGNETLQFTDYPVSHSLLMAFVWALLFGGIYWLIKRDARSAFILGLCVVSHWLLDLLVHFPDLPLVPGGNTFGFGLWAFPVAEMIIEIIMLVVGIYIYLSSTVTRNKKGTTVFWVLMALLLLIQLSSDFSPAPASITALAWSAQAIWVLVLLAWWTDANRTQRILRK